MCMLVLCSRYRRVVVLLSFFIHIIAVIVGSIKLLVMACVRCARSCEGASGEAFALCVLLASGVSKKNRLGSPSNQGHPRPDTARGVGPKGRVADGTQRVLKSYPTTTQVLPPCSRSFPPTISHHAFHFLCDIGPFFRFSPHIPNFAAIFSVHLGRFALCFHRLGREGWMKVWREDRDATTIRVVEG